MSEYKPTINASETSAEDMFSQILQRKIQAGALEAAIEKKVDDLINQTAESVFSSYGELAKTLEKQLSAAIMPKLENLNDLPVYHSFVAERLKAAANSFYDERLQQALDKELKEIANDMPEKLNLSEIVDHVLANAQDNSEYDDQDSGSITLIVNQLLSGNNTSILVYIDEEGDKSRYECQYQIHLSQHGDRDSNEYEILSLTVNGRNENSITVGKLYRLDKKLFNVHAFNGKIILDKGFTSDDYDTYWEMGECY